MDFVDDNRYVFDQSRKTELCFSSECCLRECLRVLDDIERLSIVPGSWGVGSVRFHQSLISSIQMRHTNKSDERYDPVTESIKGNIIDSTALSEWETRCNDLTIGLNQISNLLQNKIKPSTDCDVWTAVGSISLPYDANFINETDDSIIDDHELRFLFDTILESGLLPRLLANLLYLRVSTRTAVCRFTHLLLCTTFPQSHDSSPQNDSSNPGIFYILSDPNNCSILADNLRDPRLALSSCVMLDSVIRSVPNSSYSLVYKFFITYDIPFILLDVLSSPALEARSAALGALRRCLLHTQSAGPDYINEKYSLFFNTLDHKLIQPNDVTIKRPVIKLLFDILSERLYLKIMLQYVNDVTRLETLLETFLSYNDSVSFEAFHLLKLYVRNPRKSKAIEKLLSQRRNDLLLRLTGLNRLSTVDEAFHQDRKVIIEALVRLL